MLNSLALYINAQKWVAINFIILGIILLVFAFICMIMLPKSALINGLKWACVGSSAFIMLGGFVYGNFNNNLNIKAQALYEKSIEQFVATEHERMEIVEKGFIKYQISFAAILMLSILVVLFIKPELFKGIAFAFAFLMLGVMLIEAYSHKSISDYAKVLREE